MSEQNKAGGAMERGSKTSTRAGRGASKMMLRHRVSRSLRWFAALLVLATIAVLATVLFRSPPARSPDRAARAPAVSRPRALATAASATRSPPSPQTVREKMLAFPLRFERNEGQFDQGVRYLARAEGLMLALGDEGPTLLVTTAAPEQAKVCDRDDPSDGADEGPFAHQRAAPTAVRTVHMRVANAKAKPELAGSDELATKTNYYLGSDARKWRANVGNYGRVSYRDVLPGIDVVYHGDGRKLEYDFVLAPGASPEAIEVDFDGADGIARNEAGELEVAIAERTLIQQKPVIYQEIDGQRQFVDGAFRVLGQTRVGFEVAAYDRSRPLVIDPIMLFATYVGGSLSDNLNELVVTPNDEIAIVGRASSADFPTANPTQATSGGSDDAFVTVLGGDGSYVAFSTYFGGSGTDVGIGLAVDASGALFAGGMTSSADFPLSNSPIDVTLAGGLEGFVLKIDSAGSLVFSTFLGGGGFDLVGDLEVDSTGDVYAVGVTLSADLPTSPSAYATTNAGAMDAFVSKILEDGSALVYSTYLGGDQSDSGHTLAVDASENVVVVGLTASAGFPTKSAYQATLAGTSDAFIAKLNADGSDLIFSTYLGGSDTESAEVSLAATFGVALDAAANVYVTGSTMSEDFPTASAFQPTLLGDMAAFVTKLSATGASLIYSTYLGGAADETFGTQIAVDDQGRAYVVGITSSLSFPLVNATQPTVSGQDGFLTVFSASGAALEFSTYFGGGGSDSLYGVALTSQGRIAVAGDCAAGLATTGGAYAPANSGATDVCVALYSFFRTVPGDTTVAVGDTIDFGATGAAGSGSLTWVLTDGSGASLSMFGEYEAGSTINSTDVITVTDDESGETASATITVLDRLIVSPSRTNRVIGEPVAFSTTGHVGGYTFSLLPGGSGGVIHADSGAYVAGSTGGVADTVRVTDGLGRTVDAVVSVRYAPFLRQTFSNPTPFALQVVGDTEGPASLYPSTISVTGMPGLITSVTVALKDLTHTFSGDLQFALVGPTGVSTILMSRVGGGTELENVTIILDQAAASRAARPLTAGSYRPAIELEDDTEVFPAPAPVISPTENLRLFNGTVANGTWSLWAFDAAAGDEGISNGGWSLTFTTANLPPLVTVPGAQTTDDDTGVVFSSANSNAISISDPDAAANPVQVTLTATSGTLTLSSISGLNFADGSGSADATMTFAGTVADINSALAGLLFQPTEGTFGAGSIDVLVDDLSSTGTGSALTDGDVVSIGISGCSGNNLSGDADEDGTCNDADTDDDDDGLLDGADTCLGGNVSGDDDADGTCNDWDPDDDNDHVLDGADVCDGNDASGDGDSDGFCNDIDRQLIVQSSNFTGVRGPCTVAGGVEIVIGLDEDASGTLEPDEIVATNYACAGVAGTNGRNVVFTSTPLIAPNVCVNGGVQLKFGLDDNGNTLLDVGELDVDQVICNGAVTLMNVVPIPPPYAVPCTAGGSLVEVGIDQNANTLLDANEVTGRQRICTGLSTRMRSTPLLLHDLDCPNGGVRIELGVDDNGDLTLADLEVDATTNLCAGFNGVSSGRSLLPGTGGCTSGGVEFSLGTDANGNGTLDVGEMRSTQTVCHGVGSLIVTTTLPPGSVGCPNGGVHVTAGSDDDRSGTLAAGEIDADETLCNGLGSLVETSVLAPGSAACPGGGIAVRAGVDADGSGSLSSGEGGVTRNICQGDDSLVRVATLSDDPRCPNDGVLVDVGLDLDGDGVLEPGEVTFTQPVCNGLRSLTALTELLPYPGCPTGGVRVDVGLDDDGDEVLDPAVGLLDPGEVDGSATLCAGLNAVTATSVLARNPLVCPAGGVKLEVGIDDDGDRVLDAGEVSLTQNICDGLHSLIAMTELAVGTLLCPNGGIQVTSGTDLNGSGVLDPGPEISATQVVCDGLGTLVATTTLVPGAACPRGGARIDAGRDDDGNGTLAAGEIDATATLCNGLGSLVETGVLAPGAACPGGGIAVRAGVDADGDGVLDAGELAAERAVCHGDDSLLDVVTLAPNPALCPTGGIRTSAGRDADADGVLDAGEVSASQPVCNGLHSLVTSTVLAPSPALCPTGGTRVDVGLDLNGDGVLEAGEIDGSATLCAGLHSASATHLLLPDPAVCPTSGVQLDLGLDADGDGVLTPTEVSTSQTLCHGLHSLVETSELAADPAVCPNAGLTVRVGTDRDGSGTLTGSEVSATQAVCNGLGTLIAITTLAPDPALCPSGGARVEAGTDDDGNGLLDQSEVSSTQTVCHGLNSLVATTTLAPDAAKCPTGGVRVSSGTDTNGGGTLDAGEVSATQIICNGLGTRVATTTLAPNPAVCATGGSRIDAGLDVDGDAVLDASEISATETLCNGLGSLVETSVLAPDPARCPAGGIAVRVGVDADGSGSLIDAEVRATRGLCHGDDSLVRVSALSPDAAVCPAGGIRVDAGLDRDGDGILGVAEVSSSERVCRSSLTRTTTLEANPAQCASGGTRLESGTDDDGDGVLADREVDSTQLLCGGSGLAVRTTVLAPGSLACPAGGSLLETGLDSNANGSLEDAEVRATSALCGATPLLIENETLPPNSPECVSGGLRVRTGHDDGQPAGIPGDGLLQPDEVEASHDVCLAPADVLISGGKSSCSMTAGTRSDTSVWLAVLTLALTALTRRRRRAQRRLEV